MDDVPLAFQNYNFDALKKASPELVAWLIHAFMPGNRVLVRHVVSAYRVHQDCASDVKHLTGLVQGTRKHPDFKQPMELTVVCAAGVVRSVCAWPH